MQAPEPTVGSIIETFAESIAKVRRYARTPDIHHLNGACIMKQRQLTMVAATAVALSLISGCAVADDGFFMSRHPNIEAADFNVQEAIGRMRAAQQANDYHMGGHAGRAIQLMQEARYEMQAAAEVATR
jgi:hypothetical protein